MSDEAELLTALEGIGGRSSVDLLGLEMGCYPRELRARLRLWRERVCVPCEVAFSGVLAVKVEELDFSESSGYARLVEVPASPWLAQCKQRDHSAKVHDEHRHYVLRTYDDVIEVLCSGYAVTLGEPWDASPVEGEDDLESYD